MPVALAGAGAILGAWLLWERGPVLPVLWKMGKQEGGGIILRNLGYLFGGVKEGGERGEGCHLTHRHFPPGDGGYPPEAG